MARHSNRGQPVMLQKDGKNIGQEDDKVLDSMTAERRICWWNSGSWLDHLTRNRQNIWPSDIRVQYKADYGRTRTSDNRGQNMERRAGQEDVRIIHMSWWNTVRSTENILQEASRILERRIADYGIRRQKLDRVIAWTWMDWGKRILEQKDGKISDRKIGKYCIGGSQILTKHSRMNRIPLF